MRILVSMDAPERGCPALAVAARLGRAPGAQLRVVHLRIFDRVPQTGGRFYFEPSLAATAALDDALRWVWRTGVTASGVVLDAPRAGLADAVLAEAARWDADAVVLSYRPRKVAWLGLAVFDRMARQVMRRTTLPVLAVHPGQRSPSTRRGGR